MSPDNERGRPRRGATSQDLTASLQLDLNVTDSTAPSDSRPRTDPDPAARRHNLEGRRRRDEAITYAGANTPIGWADLVDDTIVEFAERCVPFVVDDIREVTGHPLGASDNAFGARFMAAARRGLIRKVGYQQSTRPERHGGIVAVWQGAEVSR